jgi:predicted phosphodiesterase
MRRFHLLSDLHTEFSKITKLSQICKLQTKHNISTNEVLPYVPNMAENKNITLLLAGDIGQYNTTNYLSFIRDCAECYKGVILVTGNHEYYNSFPQHDMKYTIPFIDNAIQHNLLDLPNVHFLQKSCVDVHGVKIVGCTLWSHIPHNHKTFVEQSMNDYEYIESDNGALTVYDTDNIHKDHAKWLYEVLHDDKDTPTIVLTHHMPSLSLIHQKYAKYRTLNSAFASDMEHLFLNNVKIWCYGHTHTPLIKLIDNTLCITNPLGYEEENSEYQIVEFDL